jgi:hypothetical protein
MDEQELQKKTEETRAAMGRVTHDRLVRVGGDAAEVEPIVDRFIERYRDGDRTLVDRALDIVDVMHMARVVDHAGPFVVTPETAEQFIMKRDPRLEEIASAVIAHGRGAPVGPGDVQRAAAVVVLVACMARWLAQSAGSRHAAEGEPRHLELSALTKAEVGRRVVYRAQHADAVDEHGVISSWNDEYVFVRYGADIHTKATNPEDLEWFHGAPETLP